MPEMSALARGFCTSLPYRAFSQWVVLPWAMQGFSPSGEALEIGSGSGAMAAQLLRKFPRLRIVATDYDTDMVATAGRRLASFGERAQSQRVDAVALPFPDGSFDLVLSFAMLHHVTNWRKAVAEAVRMLRPGGRLLGFDLLHGAPAHHTRHGESGDMAMMRPGQLEAELQALPVSDVRTRRSVGGFALRFAATRTDSG